MSRINILQSVRRTVSAGLAAAVCISIPAAAVAQRESAAAVTNPFSRPAFAVALARNPQSLPAAAPPELRATLVANGSRRANIDGVTLTQGQRYREYVVERIEEGRVVLRNGTDRIVLDVYARQVGGDDENP